MWPAEIRDAFLRGLPHGLVHARHHPGYVHAGLVQLAEEGGRVIRIEPEVLHHRAEGLRLTDEGSHRNARVLRDRPEVIQEPAGVLRLQAKDVHGPPEGGDVELPERLLRLQRLAWRGFRVPGPVTSNDRVQRWRERPQRIRCPLRRRSRRGSGSWREGRPTPPRWRRCPARWLSWRLSKSRPATAEKAVTAAPATGTYLLRERFSMPSPKILSSLPDTSSRSVRHHLKVAGFHWHFCFSLSTASRASIAGLRLGGLAGPDPLKDHGGQFAVRPVPDVGLVLLFLPPRRSACRSRAIA